MKLSKLVNVIDLEATCWTKENPKPDNETQEIIEIGISVVDIKTLQIVSKDSILVKPQISKVSKFCTELTTLTQKQVDTGISFQKACGRLKNEFNSRDRTWISWGNFDRKMFERNCLDFDYKYPFGPSHINLKNIFAIFHCLDKEKGLDAALQILRLPFEGTAHRGIDDSLNIAKIFIETLKKFRKVIDINETISYCQSCSEETGGDLICFSCCQEVEFYTTGN